MFVSMTPEEMEALDQRVLELRSSESPEDRIVAVLMDSVGGYALREDTARAKARAITRALAYREKAA